MQENLISQFVERLIQDAGLDNVPENFRAEYTEKIGAEVQKRIGLIAVKEMGPETLDEFAALLEKDPKPEEMNKFFASRIPDLDKKVSEALREFSEEFLAGAEKLKKMV